MRILVFGATGGTGRCLVEQGLERGHRVTAFVRNPKKLGGELAKRVQVVRGDALDPRSLEPALRGQDAVLSALGATSRGAGRRICSVGTGNVVAAMRRQGVRRLVVESAYGAGETATWAPYSRWLRLAIRSRLEDKERMEETVRQSGVDWVIVRPPILTNGPRTGRYRIGTRLHLGWFPKISRADVAEFMLQAALENTHVGAALVVTY